MALMYLSAHIVKIWIAQLALLYEVLVRMLLRCRWLLRNVRDHVVMYKEAYLQL